MVRHQAVSNDGGMVLLCQFSGPLEIIKPIIFFLEYVLAVVSSLYGMMAYIGHVKISSQFRVMRPSISPVYAACCKVKRCSSMSDGLM